MGKKKTEEAPPAPPPTNKADEEEEDTPLIKELKQLDDKFCAIEIEFEQETELLRKKYREEKQASLLTERTKILSEAAGVSDEDQKMGTPACKGFWLTAMQNCEDFAEILEEWDDDPLKYLTDIKRTDLDDKMPQKGFKLEFSFKENPYFSNSSLSLEIHMEYDPASYKPWKEEKCIELKATEIDWKPGKNITVEVIQKKPKGGGAKKQKQKGKSKEEARDSFFRHFFRNLKVGDAAPPELAAAMMDRDSDDEGDDDKDEMIVAMALDQALGFGHMIAEALIPYAVRYYTGEACEQDDDDEDSESEDGDDEDDDDDDEDDDSEDEPPQAKGKKKPAKKGGATGGEKTEECKQQ